jgi:hypothetical protein
MELGGSEQLYVFDQTNFKAEDDRVYEDIPLVPPIEIATVMIANLTWRYLSNIAAVKVHKELFEDEREILGE